MIVLDASAAVEFLLRPASVPMLIDVVTNNTEICVPGILELEVMNVMRKQVRDNLVPLSRATAAIDALSELHLTHYKTRLLAKRIWQLRDNMTSYDASYVALAEQLSCPLVTHDNKFTAYSNHSAKVQLV